MSEPTRAELLVAYLLKIAAGIVDLDCENAIKGGFAAKCDVDRARALLGTNTLRAERDEAIDALRNLVQHDRADDWRNRLPNCIELQEAIAILSKHPPKVTT